MSLYMYTCRRHSQDNCERLLCVRTILVPKVERAEQWLEVVEAAYANWSVAGSEEEQLRIVEALNVLRPLED
jgi:hypothetical protein